MGTVRIATVKATGERFVVQQLDFKNERAYLWGQVTAIRGLSMTHEKSRVFRLDTVEVETVDRTQALCLALLEQSKRAMSEAGHAPVAAGSKNTYYAPEAFKALR